MDLHTNVSSLKLNGNDLKQEALKLCGEFLGTPWDTISDFTFSIVSGGLSNKLYCCSLPDDVRMENPKAPKQVLLRIYGPIQEDEHVVVIEATTFMLLSEKGLGPKLYGVFPSGRLEEYIPSRSLSTDDIRRLSRSIAREMAKIHSLSVPVRKTPDLFPAYMKRWLPDIEEETIRKYNKSFSLSSFYKEEMEWLTKEMEHSHSPVVYCHNDLQGGNILLRQDSPSDVEPNLILIDFEFGGYNYRGFDLANHFCEWCFDYNTPEIPHFTFDISKYPSKQEQIEFIRAYLDQLVLEGCLKASSIDAETETILAELKLFGMAAHLYWSLWGEKMKFLSSLDFCHKAHSEARRSLFRKLKEKYLKRKLNLCNGS